MFILFCVLILQLHKYPVIYLTIILFVFYIVLSVSILKQIL